MRFYFFFQMGNRITNGLGRSVDSSFKRKIKVLEPLKTYQKNLPGKSCVSAIFLHQATILSDGGPRIKNS